MVSLVFVLVSGNQRVRRILRHLHTFILLTVSRDKSPTRRSKKNVTEFRSFIEAASGDAVEAALGGVTRKQIPQLKVCTL